MSDKQSEFKDNSTTYHAQMWHQSKNKLELHDQSEYKRKSMTYQTRMRHETKMKLKNAYALWVLKWMQEDNDLQRTDVTSK